LLVHGDKIIQLLYKTKFVKLKIQINRSKKTLVIIDSRVEISVISDDIIIIIYLPINPDA
jgi:hypothetical protein